MHKLLFKIISLLPLLITSNVFSAKLLVNENDLLIGATDVSVNGTLYDLSIVVGTGTEIFYNSATDIYDFDIPPANGFDFANAFVNQVLVGDYFDKPSSIAGCSTMCELLMPLGIGNSIEAVFLNVEIAMVEGNGIQVVNHSSMFSAEATWIDWTLAADTTSPIPVGSATPEAGVTEPATLALFALTLAGFAARRFKH